MSEQQYKCCNKLWHLRLLSSFLFSNKVLFWKRAFLSFFGGRFEIWLSLPADCNNLILELISTQSWKLLLAINSKMNLWIHLDTFGGLITHLTQTDNSIKGNTLPFPQGNLSADEFLDILHPIYPPSTL